MSKQIIAEIKELESRLKSGASSLSPEELAKVKAELDSEYNLLPKLPISEGDTVYLHLHRNADHALENPTGGMRATVVHKLPSGYVLRCPAYRVNNAEMGGKMKGEHGFVAKKGVKALVNAYVHALVADNNRGLVVVGSMSSHPVE